MPKQCVRLIQDEFLIISTDPDMWSVKPFSAEYHQNSRDGFHVFFVIHAKERILFISMFPTICYLRHKQRHKHLAVW